MRSRPLLALARRLAEDGEDSKFEKLRGVLRDPAFAHEKFIVFTEHRDTAEFLVRRLEGLGFTGQAASIHGGLDYRGREAQVDLFRRPPDEGGANYLVATDAAGEGIVRCVRGRRVYWTYHVNMWWAGRHISRQNIYEATDMYEVVDAYPDDKYLPR